MTSCSKANLLTMAIVGDINHPLFCNSKMNYLFPHLVGEVEFSSPVEWLHAVRAVTQTKAKMTLMFPRSWKEYNDD